MRLSLFILILSLLLIFSLAPVSAGTPDVQPWMYAAALEGGFGTVENVQAAFGYFQVAQAVKYKYTPDQWKIFYTRDVSAFLAKNKCATCWIGENYVLSPKLRIDIPIALCDFGKGQCFD